MFNSKTSTDLSDLAIIKPMIQIQLVGGMRWVTLMLLVQTCCITVRASTSGLRDVPLAGGRLQYLDGTWTAHCVTPSAKRNGTCTFLQNVDYDITNTSTAGLMTAASQDECCFKCWNRNRCAAAVFLPATRQCYAKEAAALSKKVPRDGRVACVLGKPAPPTPPTACAGGQIAATVPGDLLTDLERANKIGDPLFELNFKDPAQQALWTQDWIYTRQFKTEGISPPWALVFDSVKMGARVYLDGTLLGKITDQFLRYIFPVTDAISPGQTHNVSVAFDASIDTQGRFMACSGGWDWAPVRS